jgi:hypothetical protein
LPENIKIAFPNINIKVRPKYEFKGIPDPFWVSGFTSGDGSFHVVFRDTGSVFLRFSIHLHIRDLEVLKSIATYFKQIKGYENRAIEDKKIKISAGSFSRGSANLQITKNSDIVNIIIPFFNKYPIKGMKNLDFEDFKKIQNIIENKEYLTNPSLYNEIKQIKSGMNLNRK